MAKIQEKNNESITLLFLILLQMKRKYNLLKYLCLPK